MTDTLFFYLLFFVGSASLGWLIGYYHTRLHLKEAHLEKKAAIEKLALVEKMHFSFAEQFKGVSADALKHNNETFMHLAEQTFDKKSLAIRELIKPVKDTLEKFDGKIQEIEKSRAGAYATLKEQVGSLIETQKELRTETRNLVKALRAPTVRGRWGEMQLKRVVEMAGMLDHCDFFEQQSCDSEDGRLRPDLLVRLPGTKNIVVDAKAPLSAYLDAIEAKDEETRTALLHAHAQQ